MASGGLNHEETAQRDAAEGLRLCLGGDEAGGLARYREVAEAREAVAALPLGLHVHMLREAGRGAAADAVAGLTLQAGGDLAWKARGGAAEAAADEYERFFAQGLGNALMVNRYLAALTALGRTAEVAAIFDPGRLLHRAPVEGAAEAARLLLDHEARLEPGSRMSIRGMREVRKLRHRPEFAPLLARFRTEAGAYLARWAASDHPLAHLVPQDFTLGAWGLISRGEGYNVRHNHPRGWVSGVYYPASLPDAIAGGSLCFGGWKDPAPPGWPEARLRPEAGTLVLFPSYYVHWTEPLGAPGLRLAIAFDAVPV